MSRDITNVELGGIEPPSAEWLPNAIRPFPIFSFAAAEPSDRLACALRRIFLRCQWSFTPSAVSPCCPPLLLLPGCNGLAPCASQPF